MFSIGDAINNGLQGYRQAENDNGLREDREYRKNKRAVDDEFTAKQRERNGLQWEREDKQYEADQKKSARITALRDTWDSYAQSKVTGDLSGLKGYMQLYDLKEGADIADVQYGGEGKIKISYDDGSDHSIDESQFVQMMKMQFSPENWMKLEKEKEMLGLRADATKGINSANAENQKGVQKANVQNVQDIATHANGLKPPTTRTYTDEDGKKYTRFYVNADEYEEQGGYEDPAVTNARTNANKQPKGSGKNKQLEMDKFFAQLASKQFGSPDANGNIMLDEKGGIQKSKVETLASTMYREYGEKLTPLQYFSRALKITRDNPALTKSQAVKKLKEMNIDKPNFFASKAEEETYANEVQKMIDSSESVPGISNQNGVNPPSNNSNSQAGTIQGGDPLGIR